MANRIAFNPQDRFVVAIGNTLIVTTRSGDTFGHDVTGHTADRGFQFSGAKAAFNPEDRFVVTMGNTLIVCTQSGNVFGHDIAGRNIGPGFQFTGAKAAFNAVDRFVATAGNLLIVCTQNGDVFGLAIVTDVDDFIRNDHHRTEEVLDRLLSSKGDGDAAHAQSRNSGRQFKIKTAQDQKHAGNGPETHKQPATEFDGGDFAARPALSQVENLEAGDELRYPDQ